MFIKVPMTLATCTVVQCLKMCRSVLQCLAVSCSVLQCVAVSCNVFAVCVYKLFEIFVKVGMTLRESCVGTKYRLYTNQYLMSTNQFPVRTK